MWPQIHPWPTKPPFPRDKMQVTQSHHNAVSTPLFSPSPIVQSNQNQHHHHHHHQSVRCLELSRATSTSTSTPTLVPSLLHHHIASYQSIINHIKKNWSLHPSPNNKPISITSFLPCLINSHKPQPQKSCSWYCIMHCGVQQIPVVCRYVVHKGIHHASCY